MSYSSTPRNNRRMTLSTMPSHHKVSTNNRRNSIDPSTAAPSGATKSTRRPPKSRQSMIPRVGRENVPSTPGSVASATTASSRRRSISNNDGSSSNRRQSFLVPPPPPSRQAADPRPINDKAFQHQCIKKLLAFLVDRGYEYPVSTKSLSRPSSKDFQNVTTFMLRLVDKDFGKGAMKFEDEVAQNFKYMGYPYTISKTSLVAAGSPHTWPSLLAALTWMAQHLECKSEHVETDYLDVNGKQFDNLVELQTKTDKAFFQYLQQAYNAFMLGDQVVTEKLETELVQKFEHDDNFVEQAVERVTDLNASIVEKIHEFQQQAQDLPSYAKKREHYATDLEQFHDLIRQMDDHKAALEQKVKERTAELAETNVKLDKMTTHINDLKQSIKDQEFSVDDIHKMESELKGLSEAMDRARAVQDQRRKMLLASQEEFVTVCNDLDSMLSTYNGKISELQVAPGLGAKFARMKASLNKDKMLESDQSEMLGVDLQSNVIPSATSAKTEYVEKVNQAEAQYNDMLDKKAHSDGSCMEAMAKLKIVQEKNAKCEQTLENDRKRLEAKLSVRNREVEAMENKVASLQDPVALEEQMAAYERQCAELEALRIEHQEENVAKRKAVLEEISSACQLMADHDAYFRQTVKDVNAHWQQKEAELEDVAIPSNVELDED